MKLRLSYSLLQTWQRGDVDRAVQMYFRMDSPTTRQLEEGKEMHKEISSHIELHRRLPDYMPQIPLSNPLPEKEVIVSYNELFDLKAIFDCLDGDTLHEYKSGVSTSSDYANQDQIPFYFLVDGMTSQSLKKAYLIHHNQYTKKNDFVLVWKSDRLLERARNLIDSMGPEIYAHFKKEGLI